MKPILIFNGKSYPVENFKLVMDEPSEELPPLGEIGAISLEGSMKMDAENRRRLLVWALEAQAIAVAKDVLG